MPEEERVQLHLKLPYKNDPRDHPRIGALMEQGWIVEELQRLSDKEVAVTLRRGDSDTTGNAAS